MGKKKRPCWDSGLCTKERRVEDRNLQSAKRCGAGLFAAKGYPRQGQQAVCHVLRGPRASLKAGEASRLWTFEGQCHLAKSWHLLEPPSALARFSAGGQPSGWSKAPAPSRSVEETLVELQGKDGDRPSKGLISREFNSIILKGRWFSSIPERL